jgi:hypothetical protein
MLYKIIHRYTHINPSKLVLLNERLSRKHKLQIRKKHRTNKSANSFINRTTILWNLLDNDLVFAGSVNNFKSKFKLWFQFHKENRKD